MSSDYMLLLVIWYELINLNRKKYTNAIWFLTDAVVVHFPLPSYISIHLVGLTGKS